MRFFNDTMVPVEPPRDAVMAQWDEWSYHEIPQNALLTVGYKLSHHEIRDTREPRRDIVITLGYQWRHHVIL